MFGGSKGPWGAGRVAKHSFMGSILRLNSLKPLLKFPLPFP